MTKSLLALLVLSVSLLTLRGPAEASSSRAKAYLSTRNETKISRLSLKEARRGPGHGGKIIEWAGTVQGVAMTGEGMFMFLRLAGGETIPVRARSTGTLALGTKVYVLGKVATKSGLIHHIEPLAIAPCNEVLKAHADIQKQYALAQKAEKERKKAAATLASRSGASGVAFRPDNQIMRMDARTLASRAGVLSLTGAVSWIKDFNRDLDDASATALARTILYYCGSYGVDSRLALSLFAAESCFREKATSPVGAMGIGQLMPETAADLGVRDPYDALQNAEGSIRHISYLLSRWKGSNSQYELTLASYNAGAGAVEHYGGIPPYPETINYVKTILGYYDELRAYR